MADKSKSRRRYLWRCGWRRCIWCGAKLTWKTLTCEHVLPRMGGGTDRRSNLAAACLGYNRDRGSSVDWQPNGLVLEWAIRRKLLQRGDL